MLFNGRGKRRSVIRYEMIARSVLVKVLHLPE